MAAVGAPAPGQAVLDVRDPESFARGHLAGAGNIARAEFEARRTELPARDAPILVMAASEAEGAAAAAELEALGYARVDWLAAPPASLPGGLADRGPAARLWKPSPFLEQVIDRIMPPASGSRHAVDLAGGAGREAVTLALRGWDVEAVDHDPEILAKAAALAARNGVALTTTVRDLERRDTTLPHERYALITVFRFLHRPLFPAIERAIAPGGWLVYETFRRGQERFGRPTHPRFLLHDGELSSAFPSLTVEHYDEPGPESGPILARLLARKPPS